MIGKAKSISHVSNAINYAKNKKEATEISRHNIAGETGREIAQEFRVFQSLNARCERNSFSVVLSPSIPDGINLSKEDFAKLADDFLERMKLKEHQYISFLHSDKGHKHLHIFVNRINSEGKAYKDHFISKKAQWIAECIAKDWGFTTAKEIQQQKEERLSRQIINAHTEVLSQMPGNIFEYAEQMNSFGIQMHLKQASDGKVVGIKFQIGSESIKASSVHRSFSAANLQKLIQKSFDSLSYTAQERQKRPKIKSTRKPRFRI
ncbi:relaxase/mobilization nuclease domain-containing protein [Draconibacterium orientale]|uniref:relaxase/mobilization nuclease domain-containing protein n=1 Tax=Draconibacterium orientale TaxID=1168034 RepID=UPI0029C0CC71|nr:relaxase/mobilization nuclease domain-containing protein [Draconibacterium orientale]